GQALMTQDDFCSCIWRGAYCDNASLTLTMEFVKLEPSLVVRYLQQLMNYETCSNPCMSTLNATLCIALKFNIEGVFVV
ncbi:hypothetical protein L195_g023984, partial [Trifolium pratense]